MEIINHREYSKYSSEEQTLVYQWVKKWSELSLLIIDVTGEDIPPYSPPPPTLDEELQYQNLRFWLLERHKKFISLWRDFEHTQTEDANDPAERPLKDNFIDNVLLSFYEPENLYRLTQQLELQSGIDIWEPSRKEALEVWSFMIWLTKRLIKVRNYIFDNSCTRSTLPNQVEAYLDIETTGLSPSDCSLTIVGIYVCKEEASNVIQLVGHDITAYRLMESLESVDIIHTYNGSRFDLPFIHDYISVDLNKLFSHHDLMFDCWKNNLYGGLKAVEIQLGIERRIKDVNGWEAVKLWRQYVDSFNLESLNKLLEYNKEDVMNLKTLKEKLR